MSSVQSTMDPELGVRKVDLRGPAQPFCTYLAVTSEQEMDLAKQVLDEWMANLPEEQDE